MQLPSHPQGGVQIGISDILQHRDCPSRMAFGMKRHEETGESPESWSPANAYGSSVHHALERLEAGDSHAEAVQSAYAIWERWLEPSDVQRIYEDLGKYEEREILGVTTLLNEGEISVRLFVHPKVGQVWFRAKIDRLYQGSDNPTQLVHVDFKSSKWAKSKDEVDSDIQMWAYSYIIVTWFEDLYPEHEGHTTLQQVYDQLRFGQVETAKNANQRDTMKLWLITAITAVIDDEVPAPRFNEWCPWCPLKMDCPVVQHELTDWAKARISALMPRTHKLKKDGTPSKVLAPPTIDKSRLAEYVEILPDVHRAEQVLKAFEEIVMEALKELSDTELAKLGRRKVERSKRSFSVDAKRKMIELLGIDVFLHICDVSLAAIERYYGGDKEAEEEVSRLAEKSPGALLVVKDD